MGIREAIESLAQKMNQYPEGIENLNTTYQFEVSGDDAGTYQIRFRDGSVAVLEEATEEAACTLQLSDENLLKLIAGTLNATTAFMLGKLKVKGDIGSALTLQAVLKKYQ